MRPKRSRLARPEVSRRGVVAGSAASIILPLGGMLIAGVPLDRALGVCGLIFGLVALLLSEMRERTGPLKQIAYLGQEDAEFDENILSGIRQVLAGVMPHVLAPVMYAPAVGDPVAWQASVLASQQFLSADAVVVLPCHDDPRIWRALVTLLDRRVKVIVMDFEPPHEIFVDHHVALPNFVSSDFMTGGLLAGDFIVDHLRSDAHTQALILLGPSWSTPGSGRSSRILYRLAASGMLARTTTMQLNSWDVSDVVGSVISKIKLVLGEASALKLTVFSGDDRLLVALERNFSDVASDLSNRVTYVGYDGARAANGTYILRSIERCLGTVDAQPVRQGEGVGRVLLAEYKREAGGSIQRLLIAPKLVTRAELAI